MRGLTTQVGAALPQQSGPSTFREARRRMDRRSAVRRLAWPKGVGGVSHAVQERVLAVPGVAGGGDAVAR
jgi:hypothetical protein